MVGHPHPGSFKEGALSPPSRERFPCAQEASDADTILGGTHVIALRLRSLAAAVLSSWLVSWVDLRNCGASGKNRQGSPSVSRCPLDATLTQKQTPVSPLCGYRFVVGRMLLVGAPSFQLSAGKRTTRPPFGGQEGTFRCKLTFFASRNREPSRRFFLRMFHVLNNNCFYMQRGKIMKKFKFALLMTVIALGLGRSSNGRAGGLLRT
jgi:hypothetical protein